VEEIEKKKDLVGRVNLKNTLREGKRRGLDLPIDYTGEWLEKNIGRGIGMGGEGRKNLLSCSASGECGRGKQQRSAEDPKRATGGSATFWSWRKK